MFKRQSQPKLALLNSSRRAEGLGPMCLAGCVVMLFLLTGCTVISRLDVNFDADPKGVPPTAPTPTPPDDNLNWRQGFVSSAVVADPAGGGLVRVVPLPAFTSSPDDRRVFLVAVTDRFTTKPAANIRGNVRLRLIGLGTVGLGLRPLQGEQTLDFIGGFDLANFWPPSGGGANALPGFKGDRLSDPFSLASSGPIARYNPGSVIEINWTLDQSTRTFSASVLGGQSQSSTFPAVSGVVATTPIQRLAVYLWMQRPTTDTVLFIDNLRSEEYR